MNFGARFAQAGNTSWPPIHASPLLQQPLTVERDRAIPPSAANSKLSSELEQTSTND